MAEIVLHEYVPFPPEPALSSEIPNIEQLHTKLGLYSDSCQRGPFKNDLIQFRKSYTTADGQPGDKLLQWTDIQRELQIMAEAFLDSGSAGNRFWSAKRPWIREGDFIYPQDKARIIVYVKQCIFKQNRNSLKTHHRTLNAAGLVVKDDSMENGSESLPALPLASFTTTHNPPRPRTSTSKTPKRPLDAQNDSEGESLDYSQTFNEILSKSTDRVSKKRKESSSKAWVRRTNRPRKTITKPGFVLDEELELESLDGDSTERSPRVCESEKDGIAPVADMGVTMPDYEELTTSPPQEQFAILQPQVEETQVYLRSELPQSSYLNAARTNEPYPPKTNGPRMDTIVINNVLPKEVAEINWNRQQGYAFRMPQIQETQPLKRRVSQESVAKIDQAVQNSNKLTAVTQSAEPNTTATMAITSTERNQFVQPLSPVQFAPVSPPRQLSTSQPSQTREHQVHLPSPSSPQPLKAPRPKVASEIPVFVITQTEEQEWEGPLLQNISLSAFRSATAALTTSSPQSIERIKVILLGPKTIKMKILREEGEAKWEYVKKKLATDIERFWRKNRMEELVINVEPVWEETGIVGSVGDVDYDNDHRVRRPVF